jgi:ATP-dependent DNA helicase DinG
MASIRELLENLVLDNPASEIQVGDGMTDPLVGHAAGGDAKTWEPNEATVAAASAYGFGQGRDPLWPLSSPAGRTIGFPFPQPRPHQLAAIDRIVDAFQRGEDVLFEAGTGFGKSPAEIGVVSQFESAYLLIGRNDLVDQWEGDFEHFRDIGFYKARQRFDCEVIKSNAAGQTLNCSQAKTMCNRKRKDAKNQQQNNTALGVFGSTHCPACPYAINRDTALAKPYTVMTLSLGLTIFKYMTMHPGVTKRDVLVIDECSELESEIMKFFEFQASTKSIFKAIQPSIGIHSFFQDPEDEFYTRWPKVKPEMNFGQAIVHMKPDSTLNRCALWAIEIGSMAATRARWVHEGEEQEKIEEACERVVRMSNNMVNCIEQKIPHYCEVSPGEDKDDPEQYTVRVSPLEARTMLESLCAPFAKHLLFVSATTGTAEMFKAAHGFTRPLVKIEAPSGFPVANRMIYSMRSGNMSLKTQAQDAPKVMEALLAIVTCTQPNNFRFDHVNQKGIIHTYNNKITDMVVKTLNDAGLSRRVVPLRGGGKFRQEAMERFKKSKEPMILVSPSAMLGLSLNDDMGRWQCIVKVPYAFLGDQSVVHRKNNIAGWYEWQTAKDLIQTFGRIVRSDTDWGTTYILDDAFSWFYAREWPLFPRYIQEAIWQKPD